MIDMMSGAIAMGFLIAALFFLKFWKRTGDRLFFYFSLAMLAMAATRVVHGVIMGEEIRHHSYWIRFITFVIILLAILDKNRARGASRQDDLSFGKTESVP